MTPSRWLHDGIAMTLPLAAVCIPAMVPPLAPTMRVALCASSVRRVSMPMALGNQYTDQQYAQQHLRSVLSQARVPPPLPAAQGRVTLPLEVRPSWIERTRGRHRQTLLLGIH